MNQPTIDAAAPVTNAGIARLLVVDDDPFVLDLYATALRRRGYEVVTAEDGVDALERLAEERFDLMLTDRNMPRFNGSSLVLALRSAGSRMPVIMISGSFGASPLPPAIVREISVVVPKPARIIELVSAVALALRVTPMQEESRHFPGLQNLAA
jgi:DNA-binding response OmpR family regulator